MDSNSKHFMRAVADLVSDEGVLDGLEGGLAAGKELTWAAHELIKRAVLTPAQAAALIRELEPVAAEAEGRDGVRVPTVDLADSGQEEEVRGDPTLELSEEELAAETPSARLETVESGRQRTLERDLSIRPPSDRLAAKRKTSRRSRVATATLRRRRALSLGDTLGGRFRLEEEVGHGAQGVVFRAYDQSLEREVAIKLLRTDAPGAARERFVREAQALSTIQHPGIVTVFDAGQEGNALYFAMELVSGRSLEVLIDAEGKLPAARLVPILERAAAAIHYAHDQGLVHRDLKPGNLLLDEDDVPRIVDFGLVALTEGTRLTVTRGVVGTPVYMAPEQAEGGRVTRRADVYSLGAILYEGLSGQPPFSGATPMEIFRQVVQDDPPPLRLESPEVSPGLEAVCRRAMAKDPRARYPTAVAFARDLRLAFEGDHVAAPGLGVWVVRTWDRWHRRRPVLLGGLLGVVAGAIGGGAAVAGVTWRAEKPYQVVMPPPREVQPNPERASNHARLLRLAREERFRGDPEAAFAWLRFVSAEDPHDDPAAWRERVEAGAQEGLAWLELGELVQAREALARATSRVRDRAQEPPALFAALSGLALAERDYARAQELAGRALVAAPDDPDALLAYALLVRAHPVRRAEAVAKLEGAFSGTVWPRYLRLLTERDAAAAQQQAQALLEQAPHAELFPLAQALAAEDPAAREQLLGQARAHPRVDPRALPR